MSLKKRLYQDFVAYYKNGDKSEVAVLRAINGAVSTAEKSGKSFSEYSDAQVEALIASEVKKRKSTADEYASAGQTDRAEHEAWEAEFLSRYLPTQLTSDEVRVIVRNVVDEAGGDAGFGVIMKNTMSAVKGRADGKLVKQVVQEELSS